MNYKQDILKNNAFFFIGLLLYCFVGLAFIQYYGKDDLHLLINTIWTPFFDIFFKYFSKFGPIVFILSILFYVIAKEKFKTLFILLSAYLINFIIVTFVKKTFYIHVHRPTFYFEQKGIDLHLIDGVTSQIPYTFPSGHTAEAFLLMLFISLLIKKKWIPFFTISTAILMAFSRVYLSKHFLIDTIGGSILGTSVLIAVYYFFQSKNSKLLDRKIIKMR